MKLWTLIIAVSASIQVLVAAPNIVLIVGDDIGYGDFGCYGSNSNATPNIDALAEGGLRFTDYHTAGAMCSPTRASLLTGFYPQRFGSHFDGALGKNMEGNPGLPLKAVTIAERLKEADYATACFGKWHLGYEGPLIPTRQGFDVFRGLLSGDGDHHTQIDRQGEEDWYHNEELSPDRGYTADLLTDYSVDFIQAHRESPFFLYLSHLAIHFPWQGPEDPPQRVAGTNYQKEKFGIIPDPSNVAPHVDAMLRSFDESVGRVIGALEEQNLIENTIVIVTSDNGGYLNYPPQFKNISSNGIYRGQKTEVYEGGHRVPFIVFRPGTISPGTSDALTHSNDLMPTFLSLAGLTEADGDGMNLAPHFLQPTIATERTLFWRTRSARAVRRGDWKLCMIGKKTELYHLGNDPGEQINLAPEKPLLVKQLQAEWEAWNRDVNTSATQLNMP